MNKIPEQICNSINLGLVILDAEFKVHYWNQWMEMNSGIPAGDITGSVLFDYFPNLNNRKFLRNCKSIFAFGNFCFLSQKLHHYIFPFRPVSSFGLQFDYMQQSCSIFPIRNGNEKIEYICITVRDVTEIVAYEHKLLDATRRDYLTGSFNRKYLEDKLREEFERHRRYGAPLCLIIFDIDNFKNVNDSCGHLYGDFVLREVVARVASGLRTTDILARYGGEEFCGILPETSLKSAIEVAERFRESIASEEYRFHGHSRKITISLGVAALDKNITNTDMFFKKADDALYTAKREGKNKVRSAGH